MDINFEYYKIFYYVAKYCNFTKAARALGNSQPNVTRAMNNLEQQKAENIAKANGLKGVDELTLKEFINDDPIETIETCKKSK